jgi:hypothetical protein
VRFLVHRICEGKSTTEMCSYRCQTERTGLKFQSDVHHLTLGHRRKRSSRPIPSSRPSAFWNSNVKQGPGMLKGWSRSLKIHCKLVQIINRHIKPKRRVKMVTRRSDRCLNRAIFTRIPGRPVYFIFPLVESPGDTDMGLRRNQNVLLTLSQNKYRHFQFSCTGRNLYNLAL